MTSRSLRWARALLLASTCAALYWVDLPYQAQFFGISHEASLAHLHTGFLLAIAMLTYDRLPLRVAAMANLVVWELKTYSQSTPAQTYLYGVLAILATYFILRAAARWLDWPRTGQHRRLMIEDVPRFVLVGAIFVPMALAAVTVVLEMLMHGQRDLSALANPMVQTFFAKHFGILILTIPIVVFVTQTSSGARPGNWLMAALPWRVLLVGVALPVALLLSVNGRLFVDGALAGVVDYRLIVAAALIWAVLRIPVRWSMALLVMTQLLFTASLAWHAGTATGLPDVIDLFRVALESLILEGLVLLLFLYNRDRDESLARREHDSRSEPLTGLPNLAALRERMKGGVASAEIGYLLLDRTDKVSAGLGLKAEAALVRGVATHLRGVADAYYIGSGQLVLVPTAPDTDTSTQPAWPALLERMHAFEFRWAARRVRVLPYLGVVTADGVAEAVDDLILRASNAAYDARQRGETHLQRAEPELLATLPEYRRTSLHLSSMVLSRLRAGEVELYFQPIVPLSPTRTATGICGEVLCRLRDEAGVLMLPNQFIPEIQADGRMVELDLAVLRRLTAWLTEHRLALPAVERICINIAGQSLASQGFALALFDLLRAFPLPHSTICFEVTESAAIADTLASAELFEGLRGLGCHIGIDDFGVGYQSFERLKQIPVDVIKIDGSFIRDMVRNPRDRELVRASVAVARAFKAETVAEFVGDAATVSALRMLSVDWGQGYHFGRPVPIEQVLLPTATELGHTH